MKTVLAFIFSFIAASSFALDIATTDKKLFQDCEVKSVEKDGVRIMHRDGSAFLDFDTLPIALQKQYGWTAEKSAARKAERAAEAERQRIAAENARRAMEERAAAIAKENEERAAAIAKENEERAAAIAKEEAEQAKRERLRKANAAAIKEEKEKAEKTKADEEKSKAEKEQDELDAIVKSLEERDERLRNIIRISWISGMFIPAIVALIRKKGRFGTVVFVSSLSVAFGFAAALNPFNTLFEMAAWTLHGACWIIALLFALQNKTDEIKQEVHIHNVYQPTSPQQPRPVAQVQPVAVPRVVGKPLPPSVNPPPPTA